MNETLIKFLVEFGGLDWDSAIDFVTESETAAKSFAEKLRQSILKDTSISNKLRESLTDYVF